MRLLGWGLSKLGNRLGNKKRGKRKAKNHPSIRLMSTDWLTPRLHLDQPRGSTNCISGGTRPVHGIDHWQPEKYAINSGLLFLHSGWRGITGAGRGRKHTGGIHFMRNTWTIATIFCRSSFASIRKQTEDGNNQKTWVLLNSRPWSTKARNRWWRATKSSTRFSRLEVANWSARRM
jgi:hypothetical protein